MIKSLNFLRIGLVLMGCVAAPVADSFVKKEKLKTMNMELERLHKLAEMEVAANGKMSYTTENRISDLTWRLTH